MTEEDLVAVRRFERCHASRVNSSPLARRIGKCVRINGRFQHQVPACLGPPSNSRWMTIRRSSKYEGGPVRESWAFLVSIGQTAGGSRVARGLAELTHGRYKAIWVPHGS